MGGGPGAAESIQINELTLVGAYLGALSGLNDAQNRVSLFIYKKGEVRGTEKGERGALG